MGVKKEYSFIVFIILIVILLNVRVVFSAVSKSISIEEEPMLNSINSDPLCGDTITTNVTLTGDLKNSTGGFICPGNGLIIGANNITLNCNGFKIQGSYNGYYSIYLNNYSNISIINCNIENFNPYAIYVSSSNNFTLKNNSFIGNANGPFIEKANNVIITQNNISKGTTLSIFRVNNSTITKNTLSADGTGIQIEGPAETATIKENNITSKNRGVYIIAFAIGLITGNNIQVNSGYIGMHLESINNFTINDNNITNNLSGHGIGLGGGGVSNNDIFNNTINSIPYNTADPPGYGMSVGFTGNNNKIWRNTLYGKGISEQRGGGSPGTYCIEVGNRYLNGAGIQRAPGDCGPMPNVTNFSINRAYNTTIEFNPSLTGTFFHGSPSDSIANANYFIPQNLIIESSSGPYSENIFIDNLPNTIINCNGNLIDRTGSLRGSGITVTNSQNVTVRNCVIEGFGLGGGFAGIYFEGLYKPYSSSGGLIEGNTLLNNFYGVIVSGLNNIIVKNNSVSGSKFTQDGAGIAVSGSDNIISENTVSSSYWGLLIQAGSNPRVLKNNVFSNTYGIGFADISNTFLSENIIYNNSYGLNYRNSNSGLIEKNTINSNYEGIHFKSSPNYVIKFTNMFNNSAYNVYNEQTNNVLAKYNWWGTTNGTKIAESIYDYFDNYQYGVVDFRPFLDSPISNNLAIITPSTILPNVLGIFSSHQFNAANGIPPYVWSLVSGNIPNGMNLYSDGVLNGTPIEAGNFTFTVRVIDSNNSIDEKQFTKIVYVTLPPAQLRIQKVGTRAVPGRILDYFIAVENIGEFSVQDIKIIEFLEISLFNLTSTTPPASVEEDENTSIHLVSWNLSTLAPFETKIFNYRVRLNQSTPIGTEVVGEACPFPADNFCECSFFRDKSCQPSNELNLLKECIESNFPAGVSTGEVTTTGGEHQCSSTSKHFGGICRDGLAVDYGLGGGSNCDQDPAGCSQNDCSEGIEYKHGNTILAIAEQCRKQLNLPPISGSCETQGGCTACKAYHVHIQINKPGCGGTARPIECTSNIQNASLPVDPNEKGVINNKFIQPNETLTYTVHFENIGSAEAKDVFITDVLDKALNSSTIEIFDFDNGTFIFLPEGSTVKFFEQNKTIYNQTIGNVTINITAIETWSVSLNNNILFWNLSNIYLPINATDNVLFSIKPLSGLQSGTEIKNNATVFFERYDNNLTTNDTINIIDDTKPQCIMNNLSNITIVSTDKKLNISWNGFDNIGEIESYTIFTSVNYSGFSPVINNTGDIAFNFTTEIGKSYSFICIAKDTAGNVEIQDPVAEASTTILLCGNVNNDNRVTAGDIVYLINYIFKGGPAPNPLETGDVNGDGDVDTADIIYLVNYIFKGGPVPTCSQQTTTTSSTASLQLKNLNKEKVIQLKGNLQVPASGMQLNLVYDPLKTQILEITTSTSTNEIDLFVKDEANLKKIGLLKTDGSKQIPSGAVSLLNIKYSGDASTIKISQPSVYDPNVLEMKTTIITLKTNTLIENSLLIIKNVFS